MEILTKLSVSHIAMMLLAIAILLVFVSGPGKEWRISTLLLQMWNHVRAFIEFADCSKVESSKLSLFLGYHEKLISSASSDFWRSKSTWRTNASNSTSDESSRTSMSDYQEGQTVKIIPLAKTPEDDEDPILEDAVEPLALCWPVSVSSPSSLSGLPCFPFLSIWLESERTLKTAVMDFNVFSVIIVALLKSRFVLSSTSDHVGLCILIDVAGDHRGYGSSSDPRMEKAAPDLCASARNVPGTSTGSGFTVN